MLRSGLVLKIYLYFYEKHLIKLYQSSTEFEVVISRNPNLDRLTEVQAQCYGDQNRSP